jgi:hypothetical protein
MYIHKHTIVKRVDSRTQIINGLDLAVENARHEMFKFPRTCGHCLHASHVYIPSSLLGNKEGNEESICCMLMWMIAAPCTMCLLCLDISTPQLGQR